MGAPDMRNANIIRYALTKAEHAKLQAQRDRPITDWPVQRRSLLGDSAAKNAL